MSVGAQPPAPLLHAMAMTMATGGAAALVRGPAQGGPAEAQSAHGGAAANQWRWRRNRRGKRTGGMRGSRPSSPRARFG